MILRSTLCELFLASTLAILLLGSPAAADSSFDCHVTVDGSTYDLTKAAGEHTASRTRETPPSSLVETLRFSLCDDLKKLDEVADDDQCGEGTRACLTKINKKGSEPDRITEVIPIVKSQDLKPEIKPSSSPKGLSIFITGPEYPASSSSSVSAIQYFNLTFLCDPDQTSDPKLVAYDGSRLDLEWSGPAACPFKEGEEDPGKGDDKNPEGGEDKDGESVGSGIGWFFLVLLLAFLAYFGLGAYYNYSTYGARGIDLIPHRDFWQEVPYMIKDVVAHLCSTVRPRRGPSRGGYMSV